MSDDLPPGIDPAAVTSWLAARVTVAPPLSFHLITGGHSNLTYRVTDTQGRAWVLRRPPLGQVLATAHDMEREHRIITALAPTDVPVAPVVGLSPDDSVNGAPFYVMDFVEGHVVRSEADAAPLPPAARARAGEALVDVLARIHDVDPGAVGLGDLGRTEGYIPRQLKRWYGQWQKSKSRDLPAVDTVHDTLLAHVPEQGPATIVHGDYRLDNCLLTDAGEVAAVLDWEICTLGDPLADVGLLVVYWGEDGTAFTALPGAATAAEGFPRASELLARYTRASGRSVADVDFYIAFGYWKLACILEGVATRYRGGSMGEGAEVAEMFDVQVELLARAAEATVARMGVATER
ncbi:MAG TPA: phosphotransferase family protein [Acidimicrobiales bacterium]|nr:phosphotransferase family protein [Acidimicrobiales bacterium]